MKQNAAKYKTGKNLISLENLIELVKKTGHEVLILNSLSDEEKEDLGLLLLMQQTDRTDTVSHEEVMNALEDKKI